MALKFQYNKTAMQRLRKELKIRTSALPTLKAKEAALRIEVKKAAYAVARAEEIFATKVAELQKAGKLWNEFPSGIVKVKDISLGEKKIAGVKTPILKNVAFTVEKFSLVTSPAWFLNGVSTLKDVAELQVRIEVAKKTLKILEFARKKTTQKVNLYEKVQIPEYEDALRRIKRFMEDEENLAKSSQKILKARLALAEEAA